MTQRNTVILAAIIGGLFAVLRARGLDLDWLFIGVAVGANIGLGLYAVAAGTVSFAGKSGPFRTYTGASARLLGTVMVVAGAGFLWLFGQSH